MSNESSGKKEIPPFSDKIFQSKIKRFAGQIGCRGLCTAFQLFYVLRKPDLPLWAKTRIIAALAYFVSFIDAVPDLLPGVGYSDDIVVLIAAIGTVTFYIDTEVRRKAQSQVARFFKNCDCAESDDSN